MSGRRKRFGGGIANILGEKARPDIKASVVGRLYSEEGWSLPKLAEYFKVAQYTIRLRLEEAGVSLRPKSIACSRLALIRKVAADMKARNA